MQDWVGLEKERGYSCQIKIYEAVIILKRRRNPFCSWVHFQRNRLRMHSTDRALMLTLTPASARLLTGSETGSGRAGGPHSPEVRALLESGPRAAAHSPLAERNGFLRLQLLGYRASFLMSTLRNLAHFLEDDTAPQVLPMEISVRDTHVNLKVRIVSRCATMARMLLSFLDPKCQLSPEAVVAVCLLAILQSRTCAILCDGVAVIGLISHCRTVEQASITPLKVLNRGVIGLLPLHRMFNVPGAKKKNLTVFCSRMPVPGTAPLTLSPRPSPFTWTA